MQLITSLGELRGFTCVRSSDDERNLPWFELKCEKGKWFFVIDYHQVASGSVVLRRKVGDDDWNYAFHDIRLLATVLPLLEERHWKTHTAWVNLLEGDYFPICENEDQAWDIVYAYRRELNLDIIEHAYSRVEWVDASLRPISRRESVVGEAKLRVLQNLCATAYSENEMDREKSRYSQLVQATEVIMTRQLRESRLFKLFDCDGTCWIDSDDFEYLLELRNVMEIAARSINAHIDRKDYAPDKRKIDAYENLLDRERLDELAKRSDFAEDLRLRAEMIRTSTSEGYRCGVEWVRPYRPSLFPRTCVLMLRS